MPLHRNRIYLASQSPRRRELLKLINVDFLPVLLRSSPSREDVLEVPNAGEKPADFATRLAREKSECGWRISGMRGLTSLPVLGADTVVDLDGEILGKPLDKAHAESMLSRMSGRAHWVHTGLAITCAKGTHSLLSSSKVEFMPLSNETIQRYLASGEHLDKAGSYGIQGLASLFVSRIEGSYTGIMGLPLHETGLLLGWAGIKL